VNKTAAAQSTKTASLLPSSQGMLQRKCACGSHTMAGGECEECSKKKAGLQRKLAIGASNDPLELEADRVADQVMSMPTHSPVNSAPLGIQRFSGQKSEGTNVAPPSVDRVLASSGRPLEPGLRQDMEHRFGHDFSQVRVHTGGDAEQSAQDVTAHAYTVGHDIVFDANQYRPDKRRDGQNLLAHELAHVVQQNQASIPLLQRACRTAAQCAVPSTGNAAQFGVTVEAESNAIAANSGGVPTGPNGIISCNLPRHGLRATNFENLAATAGLGASIAPGIAGFFINACLSPNDGANNADCSEFPGGVPAGGHAGTSCVQVHTTDEDLAISLLAKPRPLGGADLRNFLWITSAVRHESQHNIFDANAGTIVPAAVDCSVSTVLPSGGTVQSLLSEISAEIGEFDVYFRNLNANPTRSSVFALQSEEHNIATRGGENILGNIKDLQCGCNCATVDRFVEQVFNHASGAWTAPNRAAEQREFKAAMTAFMPSFWPHSLHQR